jgi:anti-sigma regulatory factor (Ser/Thr protein kinase)
LDISLKNDLSELARLHREVEGFASVHSLPPRVLLALDLSLTELVTNTISYGYGAAANRQIFVHLLARPGEIEAVIEDDGRPFDPRERPPVDISTPLDERPIGGLGIHIVRNMMDSLEYRRDGDRNVVRILKRLG